MTSSLFSYQT